MPRITDIAHMIVNKKPVTNVQKELIQFSKRLPREELTPLNRIKTEIKINNAAPKTLQDNELINKWLTNFDKHYSDKDYFLKDSFNKVKEPVNKENHIANQEKFNTWLAGVDQRINNIFNKA